MDIEDEEEGSMESNLHVSLLRNRATRRKFFCFVGNILSLVLALDLRYLKIYDEISTSKRELSGAIALRVTILVLLYPSPTLSKGRPDAAS